MLVLNAFVHSFIRLWEHGGGADRTACSLSCFMCLARDFFENTFTLSLDISQCLWMTRWLNFLFYSVTWVPQVCMVARIFEFSENHTLSQFGTPQLCMVVQSLRYL